MTIVDDLIPHMRRVQAAERDLRDLSLLWQMIEASSAISCPEEAESILPMLTQTRVRFAALQARLVEQLGQESLAELRDELASTAQCTIDILVRNVYERTADVGFLATDDVLRSFCAAAPAERETRRAALLARLDEYRRKYTVYDDVILLSPAGEVLARLDAGSTLQQTTDTLVREATTKAGYVERFATTDLAADNAPALVHGHRIDAAAGAAVGVLVLRFRSSDEMQRIFASATDARRQGALLLLDENDRVIASNDESHVPIGARVQTAPEGDVALTVFGGREYLSVTRATHGYQGYRGPNGWRAHAMVSLLTAFRSRNDGFDERETLSLDNTELTRIQSEVDAINGDLRRVVWNGRLVAGTREGVQSRLKAVLRQINEAGTRTRDRVAIAIHDLYRTSLGRAHHQARELARLAADIMDRNLYERANDCRWWALSPVLERVLAEPAGEAGTTELNTLLSHVNGIYTVYARLVAFDAEGIVRGVSNDDPEASLIGTPVGPELMQALSVLGDSQGYAVTPFAPSPFSGGVPTYVYLAAVRGGAPRRDVGGIAIVFNAEREFRTMLDDVLGGRTGIAAFVDGEGRVVSSTDAGLPPGAVLPFAGASTVAEYDGTKFAVARVRTGGYREFKRSDGYDNQVQAVVALRLGAANRRRTALHDTPLVPLPTAARAQTREFALFSVGAGRYGLPSSEVVEARPKDGLVRAPVGVPQLAGLLEVPDQRTTRVIPVVCGRKLFGVNYAPREQDGVVLVIASPDQPGRPLFGFLVDDVSSVLDIGPEHLQPAPPGLRSHAPFLIGLMHLGLGDPVKGDALVQLIDPAVVGRIVAPPLRAAAHQALAA